MTNLSKRFFFRKVKSFSFEFSDTLGETYSSYLGKGGDINIFMNYNDGNTDTTAGIAFIGEVCGGLNYR